MPGMMVCMGRLAPPSSLGWPGSRVKPAPRFWNRIPNFSDAMPEPKPW